jgi:DNA topoisomerase VI subunit B
MDENGVVKTSVSIPPELWNEIQQAIEEDEIGFSRWVQKSSRLMLKTRKIQNVQEFLSALDESELQILKNEIKKRG